MNNHNGKASRAKAQFDLALERDRSDGTTEEPGCVVLPLLPRPERRIEGVRTNLAKTQMNGSLIERQDLERLALNAHERGIPWADFWAAVQKRVDALEPHNLRRWHKLHGRLMHLLVCGRDDQYDGRSTDLPWVEDDKPHDETQLAE